MSGAVEGIHLVAERGGPPFAVNEVVAEAGRGLRGDRHHKDEFPFTIERGGICILPLSAVELTQASSTERISFGSPKLETRTGGDTARRRGPIYKAA